MEIHVFDYQGFERPAVEGVVEHGLLYGAVDGLFVERAVRAVLAVAYRVVDNGFVHSDDTGPERPDVGEDGDAPAFGDGRLPGILEIRPHPDNQAPALQVGGYMDVQTSGRIRVPRHVLVLILRRDIVDGVFVTLDAHLEAQLACIHRPQHIAVDVELAQVHAVARSCLGNQHLRAGLGAEPGRLGIDGAQDKVVVTLKAALFGFGLGCLRGRENFLQFGVRGLRNGGIALHQGFESGEGSIRIGGISRIRVAWD